jgi:hypothetical protein
MLDGREWFKNEGASEDAISRLSTVAPFQLPPSYLALLRYSNGGEGPLPVDPWNFCLDTAELAADTEQNGRLKEFFPNLFIVGTSGGGDGIALDASKPAPRPVVQFDMTNCNLSESVHQLAPDFDAFLELIGRSAN